MMLGDLFSWKCEEKKKTLSTFNDNVKRYVQRIFLLHQRLYVVSLKHLLPESTHPLYLPLAGTG